MLSVVGPPAPPLFFEQPLGQRGLELEADFLKEKDGMREFGGSRCTFALVAQPVQICAYGIVVTLGGQAKGFQHVLLLEIFF